MDTNLSKEFDAMRKELADFEDQREKVIQLAREIIRLSKLCIYSVHRSEMKDAEKHQKQMEVLFKKMPNTPFDVGIQKTAVQEYVEAAAFLEFVKSGTIPTRKLLGAETEDYLMGLCDLSGELVRRAVQDAIQGRPDHAKRVYALVEQLYGEFLKLDLRNGELRKKADSIKWNLKRLDDLIYDLQMKK